VATGARCSPQALEVDKSLPQAGRDGRPLCARAARGGSFAAALSASFGYFDAVCPMLAEAACEAVRVRMIAPRAAAPRAVAEGGAWIQGCFARQGELENPNYSVFLIKSDSSPPF
jgi:hypothetical protein